MDYGEGSVVNLYQGDRYLGQFKSKNIQYIMLRKIREKVKVFSSLIKGSVDSNTMVSTAE